MPATRLPRVLLILICLAIALVARAQPATAPQSALSDQDITAIASDLKSDDVATIQAAVDRIRDLLTSAPEPAVDALGSKWMLALWEGKQFRVVADLANVALTAAPHKTNEMEQIQFYHTKAQLYLGSTNCLSSARGLYNLSSTDSVRGNFSLIIKCLKFVRPAIPEAAAQFLDQQRNPVPISKSVLGSVKVNDSLFSKELMAMTGDDYKSLVGRGNLLLLAGRLPTAKACFQLALKVAPENQKTEARQNIARAMKAEDGNLVNALAWLGNRSEPVDQSDILRIAQSYPDGGGNCALTETGVPESIMHKGVTILGKANGGTYCTGFTFAVAMKAAGERGLLDSFSADRIKLFQKEWYGCTPISEERQLVAAITTLGIGKAVERADMQPGDFVQYSQSRMGNSVIFLDWIKHDNEIVGFKFRSSGYMTGGVGDSQAFFTSSSEERHAIIDPEHFYVGRLNAPPAKSDVPAPR